MFIMDVDSLTVIQQERYSEFVRQVELQRLANGQQEADDAAHPAARQTLLTAVQQMVAMALPTHNRAVRSN